MSLDLTGEPFPRMDDDNSDREVVEYTRCRNGHIDIWYDSTEDERCPLCAALKVNRLQIAGVAE